MADRPYFSLTQSMTAPPAVGPWPGTTTGTNVDWEKQQAQQMEEALKGLGTLVSQAEAAQYARQQESDQLRNQYLAAASAPPIQPPPLAMALPYAAAQFSAALSGRPEIGQQAEQSLALNRASQLQRRSQILDTLAQQNQEAARRAEAAGNLTDSLKYNTKASMLLKQLEEAGTNLRESHETAVRQTYDAWKTMYTTSADYLSRLISAGMGRDSQTAARLLVIKNKYDALKAPLEKALETARMDNSKAGKAKVAELMGQLVGITNDFTRQSENVMAGGMVEQIVPDVAPVVTKTVAKPGLLQELGKAALGQAQRALKGRRRREEEAQAVLSRTFTDKSPREIIEALQAPDSTGTPWGRHLADQKKVDFGDLMKAARKRVASRGGGGKF